MLGSPGFRATICGSTANRFIYCFLREESQKQDKTLSEKKKENEKYISNKAEFPLLLFSYFSHNRILKKYRSDRKEAELATLIYGGNPIIVLARATQAT